MKELNKMTTVKVETGMQRYSFTVSPSIESRNVNLRSGPVSTILRNLLEILLACDTDEVDVLTQVLYGC